MLVDVHAWKVGSTKTKPSHPSHHAFDLQLGLQRRRNQAPPPPDGLKSHRHKRQMIDAGLISLNVNLRSVLRGCLLSTLARSTCAASSASPQRKIFWLRSPVNSRRTYRVRPVVTSTSLEHLRGPGCCRIPKPPRTDLPGREGSLGFLELCDGG